MIKRIWATFYARTLEFVRDRSTLGWNFILPVALVFGLAFVFSGDGQPLFKVGVVADKLTADAKPEANLHPFLQTAHVDFYTVPADTVETAVRKVGRHQTDMLLDLRAGQMHYWVNSDSQKGYFLEKLLAENSGAKLAKQSVQGEEIRYVDWVVPGILGMNLMFSCLFGVGFVIVRYRKSGYLKRLNATPLNATEFLLAQVFSRLLLVVVVTSIVFTGTNLFMHFTMEGSYLNLLLVLVVGAFCLIALSLVVAARVSSEELAGGLLNLLTWPMMVLSGVWFSMEGTNPIMQWLSQLSPLTHMLTAARAIMLDGAGLADITPQLLVLAGMSVIFLLIGAATFKWTAE
ncbi:ABC transporter permease [Thiothrix nivea]|uniref:Transport permease protein n=1 Tax=Thiothrix nivea (strain ATCC 35100 / DSM 5205 / JP2) TaxID=870187 RepID=A0A656HDC6_THINJ|nr:ABC transporter permease [Thiothrix nivea]EIJ34373.1 ABC-2 type transporter [Thiothrix nivea DSM 5205]